MARGKTVFTESIKNIAKRYFIDATNGMALGLFVSLIIGTLIDLILKIPFLAKYNSLLMIATHVKSVAGAAIGVGISWSLKSAPIVMFTSAATGMIGYVLGGPICAYLTVIMGSELGNLVAGRTRLDIIVTPLVSVLSGSLIGFFTGPYINNISDGLGNMIYRATELNPILMGVIISVVIGMAFTTPISAVAICVSIDMSGLAAGAACVGCCCQAIGFAVASYRDNGFGGFLIQSIGAPLLQFPNILRRPQIWLAPILSSAILGPISTTVLGMTNNSTGAGMGPTGLVGQFHAFDTMLDSGADPLMIVCMIIIAHFFAPAALTLLFDNIFRKLGFIKKGDMKIRKT